MLAERIQRLDEGRWRRIARAMRGERALVIVIVMTLLTFYMHVNNTVRLPYIMAILTIGALLIPRLGRMAWFWVVIAGLMIYGFVSLATDGAQGRRHPTETEMYLILCWCVALILCLLRPNPRRALRTSARILIGVFFLFAALWSVLGSEPVRQTLPALAAVTNLSVIDMLPMIGLEPEFWRDTVRRLEQLSATPAIGDALHLYPAFGLRYTSMSLAIWIVVVQLAVALAFLMPRSTALARWRDLPLLTFILTVYPLATAFGYATLLIVLAFAQCARENRHLRLVYAAIFIAMPLLMIPPNFGLNMFLQRIGF